MVGPPKTLYDLRRVEGAVRLKCRQCGHSRLVALEEMIGQRSFSRRPMEWVAVQHDQICSHGSCTSQSVRVDVVPFGGQMEELKRRRAQTILIDLALKIVRQGAYPSGHQPLPDEAIRLALRVLHPHVRRRETLEAYWTAYKKTDRLAHEGPSTPYVQIVAALLKNGYPVYAEYRTMVPDGWWK
ncbi:hypothetical protein [Sphingomonas sp. Mn802worker]|uniref:hypothetical protein n=1 Tax=Sphingomonas sp. Mn802worker TaxID=629773 RepID=UPI000360F476|nr:hypothetical protein [Sphingomonas sp. Mn802worker]